MKIITISIFAITISSNLFCQTFQGSSNPVKVSVSKQNRGNSDASTITLEELGITKMPTYHALIIGVSQYQFEGAGLPSLEMPTKDAELLAKVLIEKYSFEEDNVMLLKNPTREEIIDGFGKLADKSSDKDNVLIFYAGHGFYDKGLDFGYWLPSDSKHDTRGAWIANSTVKDYIGGIKAKHTLLITDACFGGSIFKTRSVSSEIKRFYDVYKDQSREAMTSGNLSEVPDKSVFLLNLLRTLNESTDVFLPSSTLFSRIYEPILNNAPTLPQFGIIQGAGHFGGGFIFIKRN